MKWMLPVAIALAAGLGGCSVYREATSSAPPTNVRWQNVATAADRERMRDWRKAWDEALPLARKADAKAIAAEPLLFDPDRALPEPAVPQGAYRCRTFKLGGKGTAMRDFTAYPWFDCRVADEGEVRSLHKVTGSQRPTGLIFPHETTRQIFLGTLVLGDETSPLRYGLDADRDMIGYVERIAPKRWRLVFPRPRFESVIDVVELVPAN
ncbi:DUF4893 domain-containing protein [Sphingomonas psychrotolerans]|uniref:DUF4893 domain-containing protein n=1 Tax=Sphingomonas psychrotolerans TaxID=1327635 RepID=A0ABU3N2W9_9SPHN|nr:DUF4893 domain-containing protein [Sphingomonas psychrotolerans]MDT8758890.1 DUF4893 domain-containing protein [Sphingomonas psychrotolerans]